MLPKNKMKYKHQKRRQVVQQLMERERIYINLLASFEEVYSTPFLNKQKLEEADRKKMIGDEDLKLVFTNMLQICQSCDSFYKKTLSKICSGNKEEIDMSLYDPETTTICGAFNEMWRNLSPLYKTYWAKYPELTKTLAKMRKKSPEFMFCMKNLRIEAQEAGNPEDHCQTFASLLALPWYVYFCI